MEHVFSCAFASGCEFTTKNLKNKNCLQALRFRWPFAAGPTPSPFEQYPFWPWVIVGHGLRGHVASRQIVQQFAWPHGL
jgi:hypothetical protein